ncbi:FHA domain-containing protein PS1-like [Forsythia ovata]|uniref:FHA domain-containing protein PS1-like n=1 Tax=Forsythia ovata TaxID=205694 RepID=A0ABD1U520_9LAMI
MADKQEESEMKAEEMEIPVFTVLKNNSILKNIYLLDKPPSIPSSSVKFNSSKYGKESMKEETLLVGRHPDCNIILEHPSISRFHLRIHSNPSSHSLSVIDLYSVHGTSISGNKIEPGIMVELKEGDTMQLGGSRRLYRLHWLPITRAYDLDNPFKPPFDTSDTVEETGGAIYPEENDLYGEKDRIQRPVDDLEGLQLLFANENLISSVQKMSPSAPPMPEDMNFSFSDKEEVENKNSLEIDHEENNTLVAPFDSGVSQTVSQIENSVISEVKLEKRSGSSIWSRRGKTASVQILVSRSRGKSARITINSEVKLPIHEYSQTETVSQDLFSSSDIDKKQIFTPDKENSSPNPPLLQSLENIGQENSRSEFSSRTLFSCEDRDEEEIITPDNSEVKSPIREYFQTESASEDAFASGDVDKRQIFTTDMETCSLLQSLENIGQENSRSKSISRTLSSCVAQNEEEIFTPDNAEVKSPIHEYSQAETVSKDAFASGDSDEKQIFAPDNENCSSNSLILQSLENTSQENPRTLFSHVYQDEEEIFTPDNSKVKSPVRGYSQSDSERKQFFTPDKGTCSLLQSLENIGQENSRSKSISRTLSSCVAQNEEEIFTPDNAEVKSPIHEYSQAETVSKDAFASGDSDEKQLFTPDNENCSSNSLILQSLENTSQENSRTLFSRVYQDEEEIFTPDKGNCSSNSLILLSLENRGQENSRSELTSQTLFSCVEEDEEEIFTPDKENMTPNTLRLRSIKNSPTPFSCVDEDEEEIFTPDKENVTPNTFRLRSMKKMGKLKEVKHLKSYRSSPLKKVDGCNMYQEEEMPASLDTENQTPKVLQKQKSVIPASKSHTGLEHKLAVLKATAGRKPFQSLLVNSTSNSKTKSKASDLDSTTKSGKSINNMRLEEVFHPLDNKTFKEEDKRWTMVVDVGCLLSKKSRKELQLLRGLKGTSLIVPRIVIRELDCMLRRGNFFRRTTEVSAALQWIEECMKNAEGWIHVQSLAEERRPVAPTPPSSPLSWFCEEKGAFSIGSSPFSPCSIQDIVTPTTEDHILECALFFKRIRNDGQLVLLSDDVTLKIKAMSEGVMCETAEEFRDSLVSPFSNRFLYTDSSPRGPTWTCVDDVVLKEKYYPGPLKKLSTSGGVKGLKLILLHNSSFRKISSVS